MQLTNFVKSCETSEAVEMLPGSIWSFMLKDDGTSCKVLFDKDSNENEMNIMWLIPQVKSGLLVKLGSFFSTIEKVDIEKPPYQCCEYRRKNDLILRVKNQ